MAIQFPPIVASDPLPQDGDTYLNLLTKQEYVCHKDTPDGIAQWTAIGAVPDTTFGYRGTVEILKPAPTSAEKGNIYSVIDGGFANMSFIGLGGTIVEQWSLIIYDGPEWVRIDVDSSNVIQGPWIRTQAGVIQPSVEGDDLSLNKGDYLINELPEL